MRKWLCSLLLLASACVPGDDSGDDNADEGGTEDTGDTGADTGDTTGGENPFDFPPVSCGEMTCGEGLLCVVPGQWCDYGKDPPAWVYPDPFCAPPPEACIGLSLGPFDECMWEALCESKGWDGYFDFEYDMGLAECPPEGLDCF